MAHLHNALHQAAPLQQAYQAALGEDDAEFAGIERAGETLTPVMDLWSKPEWAALRGERLAAGFGAEAIDAANFSQVQLFNPLGSRLLIVVEKIRILCATTGSYNIGRTATALGTLVTGQTSSRDGRFLTASIIGQIRRSVAAAAGDLPLVQIRLTGGTTDSDDTPYVLPPGFGLTVRGSAINTATNASFVWRERLIYHGELS